MTRDEMLRRLADGEPAIDVSIAKWEDIVNGSGRNLGSDNCACCEVYYGKPRGCISCPIHRFGGENGCNGAPYVDYCEATKDRARLAQAEVDFLIGIRHKMVEAGEVR